MLSNGNRLSAMDQGFDDAIPIARAYIEAAPDRVIWGSDWPHVQWRKPRMMNDSEVVELLYRYADNDKALLQKILVDNPAGDPDLPERVWNFRPRCRFSPSLTEPGAAANEQAGIGLIAVIFIGGIAGLACGEGHGEQYGALGEHHPGWSAWRRRLAVRPAWHPHAGRLARLSDCRVCRPAS